MLLFESTNINLTIIIMNNYKKNIQKNKKVLTKIFLMILYRKIKNYFYFKIILNQAKFKFYCIHRKNQKGVFNNEKFNIGATMGSNY